MDNVSLKINGITVTVPKNYTVLEAARAVNISIPTLCYLKGVSATGSCRMCVVEIKGARTLQASCVYPVSEGLEVFTNTEVVRNSRKVTLELLLSNHERTCLTCARNKNCELQTLSEELGIDKIRYEGERIDFPLDEISPSVVRDPKKCILCRRCVSVCKNVQGVSVIEAMDRGFKTMVGSAFGKSLNEVPCTMCGQCIVACPVGALREKDNTDDVWRALSNPEKHVVVQVAPAVRVALGEEFGQPIGARVTGKIVTALKMMGFDGVFDTNTAADLTIMEEGTELIQRLQNGGKLPLITSCSPGWIKFCEHNYPDFLENLSTCKSPHEMFGAILKSYYAKEKGIDPEKIVVVSVMPCTAKKYEAQRPELAATGYQDVDVVVTTREIARMIKEAGIDFNSLGDGEWDIPFGEASGAGVIFGATGGVMEAALRTVADILGDGSAEEIEYKAVRGRTGIKEAEIKIGDKTIRAAVAHGLANARKLLDKIRAGKAEYDFIEIMACPGGCVTGGGQPIHPARELMGIDLKKERAKAIYAEDRDMPVRKSHENPYIKALYDEFLGEPCGKKSHKLLHTHYIERENY